jgi:hypothetical protein
VDGPIFTIWVVQLPEAMAAGVVVLGMGRSGTSAVAGLFAAAGFYPGREVDLFGGDQHNPRGYFEHKDMFRINEEILGELGATWYQPPSAQAQLAARASVSGRLQEVFERLLREGGGAPVVLKDPRIGVMWELWAPVLAGRLHPVMVIRDSLEVGLSLQRRDGTPVPFGLAAWELHMEGLLRDLRGSIVTIAPYAGLARAPDLAGEIVASTVTRLTADRVVRVDPSAASAGFDPKLYRNRPGSHARGHSTSCGRIWRRSRPAISGSRHPRACSATAPRAAVWWERNAHGWTTPSACASTRSCSSPATGHWPS